VLDEDVLYARELAAAENRFPRNYALADIDHLSVCRLVLDVKGRETPWIPSEIRERILTAGAYPVDVQLHLHELGISVLEQPVVDELPLNPLELEVVIVVAELKARCLRALTGFVEELRYLPETFRVSQLLIDPRADEIMVANYERVFDDLIPLFPENGESDVRGGSCQAVPAENIAD
jgi:hypothetical protein